MLPTPAAMLAAKRAGKVITVGLGGRGFNVTLADYLRARRTVAAAPPEATFTAFNWFPESRAETIAAFAAGSLDRINLRAGVVFGKPMAPSRILANLKRTVKCECRWCGSALQAYVPVHARFCDASCKRSYS